VSVVVQGGKAQEEDEGLRRELFKRSFAYQILFQAIVHFSDLNLALAREVTRKRF
jgi:hypothetical protein